MQKIFTPEIRDRAIETTCSNLVQAGILALAEVAGYMAELGMLSDWKLAEQLCASRLLLDSYYEFDAAERRN